MSRNKLLIFALLLSLALSPAVTAARRPASEHIPPVRAYEASAPQKPMIALTFDDGPHPEYTDEILDALEENGARGTFFIIGSRIELGLPQIKRVLRGHQLGCHTMDHVDLTLETNEGIHEQIYSVCRRTNELFSRMPLLVRPPYGFFDERVKEHVPFPLIVWSVDTRDWETRNCWDTVGHILENAGDGDVVLMHDIYPETAEAVKIVVPELKSRGFELVTVSELFEAKGIPLEPGQVYYAPSEQW